MKKSFVLLLALVVLISSTAYYAQNVLVKEKDQVHYTESVLYGDKSLVEGARVEANLSFDYQMFWKTIYEIGEKPEVKTEYTFLPEKYYDMNRSYDGAISFEGDGIEIMSNDYKEDKEYYGMAQAMKELYDKTAPGTEESAVVFLKDYLDYYTFMLTVDMPTEEGQRVSDYYSPGFWSYEELLKDIESLEKNGTSEANKETLENLKRYLKDLNILRDFFKIPVLDTEAYTIRIRKDMDGEIIGMGEGSYNGGSATGEIGIPDAPVAEELDGFNFSVSSVFSNGDCYFTFDPHTYHGKLVDTSQIPGGYGIYHFTYDEKKGTIDLSNLKMVYALDPNHYFEGMVIDESGDNILLITSDGKERTMSVIDRKNMTLEDTFALGDEEVYFSYWCYLDYIVTGTDSIKVFELDENGRYTEALSVDKTAVEDVISKKGTSSDFLGWDCAFDWNGKTLLIAEDIMQMDEYGHHTYSADFYVAAVDETGLLYYAEYVSSLSDHANGYNACQFNRDMSEYIHIYWK